MFSFKILLKYKYNTITFHFNFSQNIWGKKGGLYLTPYFSLSPVFYLKQNIFLIFEGMVRCQDIPSWKVMSFIMHFAKFNLYIRLNGYDESYLNCWSLKIKFFLTLIHICLSIGFSQWICFISLFFLFILIGLLYFAFRTKRTCKNVFCGLS